MTDASAWRCIILAKFHRCIGNINICWQKPIPYCSAQTVLKPNCYFVYDWLALSVLAHIYIHEEKLCTWYRATYIYVLSENSGFIALGDKIVFHVCDSNVLWKLGSYPSLSIPLIGFLAYLGPKLWLTNWKLDINSNSTKGSLGHFG